MPKLDPTGYEEGIRILIDEGYPEDIATLIVDNYDSMHQTALDIMDSIISPEDMRYLPALIKCAVEHPELKWLDLSVSTTLHMMELFTDIKNKIILAQEVVKIAKHLGLKPMSDTELEETELALRPVKLTL